MLSSITCPNKTQTIFAPITSFKDVGGGFTNPKHGQIVQPTEDGLIYMPAADFCGEDSFSYTVTKGELSDTAVVTVNILCAPTAKPTAAVTAAPSTSLATIEEVTPSLKLEDDYAEGNMDEALSIPILANDIIPESEWLSINSLFLMRS